jgi:hypothetical protein
MTRLILLPIQVIDGVSLQGFFTSFRMTIGGRKCILEIVTYF